MALDGDHIADGMARYTFAKRNDATAGFVASHGAQGDVLRDSNRPISKCGCPYRTPKLIAS